MKHQHKSSTIDHSDYDPIKRMLVVKFINGGSYQYHGVPAALDVQFRNAPSAGKFFHREIKEKFKFTKL